MARNKFESISSEKALDEEGDCSIGDEKTMGCESFCGVVDRYKLIENLGQGGFGSVYRAHDSEARVEVALKALPPLIPHGSEELESVRANFALVANLAHPNIATVRHLHRVEYADKAARAALGISGGDYLVVMEYVSGSTLSSWRHLFPGKKVPVGQAIGVCRQIAEALDYAHGQKIVHRDIKPSNVMVAQGATELKADSCELTASCAVKVLDFGLAAEIRSSMSRVSQEQGDTSGTRPYMAPEQWMGKRQGAFTDQYALAILFYELISGQVPFQSVFESGDMQLMRDIVKSESVEPAEELDAKQNAVLLRALAKESQNRFKNCRDFISAISGIKLRSPRHKSKVAVKRIVAIACSVVLVGLGASWIAGSFQSPSIDQVLPLKTSAEKALTKVRHLKDHEEEIAHLENRFKSGSAYYDQEKFSQAVKCFSEVLAGCDAVQAYEAGVAALEKARKEWNDEIASVHVSGFTASELAVFASTQWSGVKKSVDSAKALAEKEKWDEAVARYEAAVVMLPRVIAEAKSNTSPRLIRSRVEAKNNEWIAVAGVHRGEIISITTVAMGCCS